MSLVNYISIFKALSDTNRIKIIELLKNGELCACKILDELHITQPTLSHHMKILSECELVISRKEGTWIHYRINQDTLKQVTEILTKLNEVQSYECV